MFRNFQSFKDAVDNRGSLYGEILEILLSFQPKAVVIMGGEPLFPTKDWGNAFIAANFSRRLKAFGVFTIGMGPFVTLDENRFKNDFDCILAGEPGPEIVDIIRHRRSGWIMSGPIGLDVLPDLRHFYPKEQITDFVMTSFGCFHHCAFCLEQKIYSRIGQKETRFVTLPTVIADIQQRPNEHLYLTDVNFSATSVQRLKTLTESLEKQGLSKTFTIDSRVDEITEAKAEILYRLGIRRVKLGVEGGTEELLRSFGKGIRLYQVEEAVRILKTHGIAVVVYLVVGGKGKVEDYEKTRTFVKQLAPEFIAINVWAYDLKTDYRYDTHFSPESLAHWGIDPQEFFKHLALQDVLNPTVGIMLDEP